MFSRISWKDLSILILHINTICSRMIMTLVRSVVNPHGRIEFSGNVENKYLILVSFSLQYYILLKFNISNIIIFINYIYQSYFRFAYRLESGKAYLLR